MQTTQEKDLSVREFAEIFKVTVGTVYDWINTGKVLANKRPQGHRNMKSIPADQVERMRASIAAKQG